MLHDIIAIQPEFLITQGGFNFKQSIPGVGDFEQTWRVTYIQIPVLAKVFIPGLDGLSAHTGFYFAIKATDKVKTTVTNNNPFLTLGQEAGTKGTDIGIPFGVEYALESGLSFSFRYNLGLAVFAEGGTAKNRIMNFGVGYAFN